MSNSAARIAEIRQALSSTGKSVSDYSARFAAGQAPEQVKVEGVIAAAAAAREASVGAALNQDEVFNLLAELTSTCKVQSEQRALLLSPLPGGRGARPVPAAWRSAGPLSKRRTCAVDRWAATWTRRASWCRGCVTREGAPPKNLTEGAPGQLDRLAATWQQARKDLERQVEQASEKEKALATENLKASPLAPFSAPRLR